jgi:hypothetical protein
VVGDRESVRAATTVRRGVPMRGVQSDQRIVVVKLL